VSKQERKAKADKKAAEVVDAAIDAAVATIASKPKRGEVPAEFAAMAEQVKELREQGVAWWQIGFKLGLPGSADNVAQGKGGAAYARKIWKGAFGDVPRVQKRDGSRSSKREKNDHVRELKATTRTERVEAVRAGTSVINPDMTNEEVIEMLDGRMITWSLNLANVDARGDEFFDTTIGVFKGTIKVHGLGLDRYIDFKEYDPSAPIAVRGIPGGQRSVRLSAIHTVGKLY
jgi:hypothetical protein